MGWLDALGYAAAAARRQGLRSALLLVAVATGVAAVVALATLGEGVRGFVAERFLSLGTHLLIVLPGRSETRGGSPPMLGETPRDLTLEDALALERSHAIARVAPVVVGEATLSRGRLSRQSVILGSTAVYQEIRKLALSKGRFIAPGDPRRAEPVCVLGATLSRELFGGERVLGRWVRMGERRFRVIGVLASRGQSIGVDLDEMAIVPVAAAQQLFDTQSLFRILVEARERDALVRAERAIIEIISARHDGEEDITVITQDALLATFDGIFQALTLGLAGIAAISLIVAGILIMNVSLVAVSQRTQEIGVLKALGATAATVGWLFILEAGLLAALGGGVGVGMGVGLAALVVFHYPLLPFFLPLWPVVAAGGVDEVSSEGDCRTGDP
ncbi:MAG: ABC transporter permease [Candidatus Competibacterales bacterium]